MKKPHILFVTEKYADCNPAGSLSNSHHNLFGSLECSELATYSNFFLEEHANRTDDDLIRLHRSLNPDVTVVTLVPEYRNNPTDISLAFMSSRSPVVFIWFDIAHGLVRDMAKKVVQYAKINVVLDDPYMVPNSKNIFLWTPQDTRIYNNPKLERNIDVSFLGTIGGYDDRNKYLNHLLSRGIDIQQRGGQREQNLTPQNYANFIQRSKISLSFSKARNGLQQTKGRLWEVTLCGALLMEDQNLGTSFWFDPLKDYVPFNSPDDLVDKANYYLSHPDEANEIAASGHRKAMMHYSPKNWWNVVLDKCN
jgi:spore maturation protein CgeB